MRLASPPVLVLPMKDLVAPPLRADVQDPRDFLAGTRRQIHAASLASQLKSIAAGDVQTAVREIVELAAGAIGCERVNAWLFNEGETELHCIEAFTATTGRDDAGMILREPDFRAEFDVLRHSRYVAADDPLTDPRTAGYVVPYVKPLGITSMLDVVIRVSDRNLGLLCFEHVGRPHHWREDEIAFACQMGDQIGLALSIAERRKVEDRLRFANTLLTSTMENSPDAILVVDPQHRILASNARFQQMWGLTDGLEPGTDTNRIREAVAGQLKDPAVLLTRLAELDSHPEREVSEELETSDGRAFEVHSSRLQPANGPFLGWVWYVRDVTERKRAEADIRHRARHDGLTGLPNRAVFKDAITRALARRRRGDRPFAVLYLDLDHFKDVNDTLGHPAGDALLRQVAARLRSTCRATDTVARFGGDEFAVLAPGLDDPQDAAVVAASVIEALSTPFLVEGSRIRTSASIGIAMPNGGDDDAEALLSQADLALYRAKTDGRRRWRFFTAAMNDEVRTRVALGVELREALARRQLFLAYQPQVELASGRLVGVEALVRWAHPTRGVLAPAAFIPIAERMGLIREVGLFVLREGCRQLRAWRQSGVAPERMALNLSTLQLGSPLDLEHDLFSVLAGAQLPPYSLELEVTEAALMAMLREQHDVLQRLHDSGCALALDDFGTGYSSLDYLRRFRIDRIKIAQQFVQGVPHERSSAAIVRAIIGLARELGVAVIAEGVENTAQADHLRTWGCLEAQGFHFSEALSADAMTAVLEEARRKMKGGRDSRG
jgi:diguanylate cyclase (GGDEF)-like protein/PAS domain S-box-containing protein